MTETTACTNSNAAPPSVDPADITLNQQVHIESRTWAGINKPGGHAKITKIHYDESGTVPNMVDVKYVLGGTEKDVELTYVKKHVELARRSRSRKSETVMNVDTLGGIPKKEGKKKKKVAIAKNKENNSNSKKRKVGASDDNKKVKKVSKVEKEVIKPSTDTAVDGGDKGDGVWKLIEGGRITDYVDTLRKGQRVSYWWSEEDGWLPGVISKALTKVTTASTIRWTIKINFDNTDVHTLNFHPLEKRWKVFNPNKKLAALGEPKKKPAAVKKSTTTTTIKLGEKKADKKIKPTVSKKLGDKDKKVKAIKKKPAAVKAAKPSKGGKQMKQSTLSFGTKLQSKIKEVSSKMHTSKAASKSTSSSTTAKAKISSSTAAKAAAAAKSSSTTAETNVASATKLVVSKNGLVRYSPNAILAVKAVHTKSKSPTQPTPSFSTVSIGYCETLPPGTLSPDKKDGKKLSKKLEQNRKRKAPAQLSLISGDVTLISPPSPQPKGYPIQLNAVSSAVSQSQSSSIYAKSRKVDKKGEETVMKTLYKKECDKAEEFVDYMKGEKKDDDASEAGSKDDSELELKLDQGRVKLFNSILSEIMFKQRLDTMDVETMIERMNEQQTSSKPFTLLEIKPFLQQLDGDGRILLVEGEGKMGTVYAV